MARPSPSSLGGAGSPMKQAQQAGKGSHAATPQINGQTSITIAQSISTLSTGKSEPAIFLSFALRVKSFETRPCACLSCGRRPGPWLGCLLMRGTPAVDIPLGGSRRTFFVRGSAADRRGGLRDPTPSENERGPPPLRSKRPNGQRCRRHFNL